MFLVDVWYASIGSFNAMSFKTVLGWAILWLVIGIYVRRILSRVFELSTYNSSAEEDYDIEFDVSDSISKSQATLRIWD